MKTPKRGRPCLLPEMRRRQMVSVRFHDETRQQLERVAEDSGRPLSQEIAHRVERSLRDDEVLAELRHLREMVTRVLANGTGLG